MTRIENNQSPKRGPIIAIDGPAGTGKSSATRRLADRLGFIHVDTGALYRAIAYLSLEAVKKAAEQSGRTMQNGILLEEQKKEAIALAQTAQLEFQRVPDKNPALRILANGRDVTEFIRTQQVSLLASQVSAIPEVRAALLGLQRKLGCQGQTILEGRDIGTVVFPDADIKFFLNAHVEERAKRRLIELEAAGLDAPSFEEVKAQMIERDRGDSSRKVAPLKKAEDAIEVDTSSLTLDQVVDLMESIIRKLREGRK